MLSVAHRRPSRSVGRLAFVFLACVAGSLAAGCSGDGVAEQDMLPIDNPDGGGGPAPQCTDKAELANFNVDVPAVTLNGKITVNGKQPTSATGTVNLVNRDTGDSVYLGRTGDASYAAKLIVPGTYDVVYSWSGQNDAGDVPRNLRARVRSGIAIKDNGALDIDLTAVTLNGKITVAGQVPTANTGSVTLRDAKTGDSFYLGRTADANYAAKFVIPGTYDIYYSWNGQNTTPIDVPRNSSARLRTGVTVQGSGALDVDIPAVTLSGKILVNGQVPTANTGSVSLREPGSGDALLLGRTSDPSYSAKLVVPGVYELVYSWNGQTTTPIDVPRNTSARLRVGVNVQQSGALDVDVPAVSLSGKITVNGQVPTANTGSVSLVNREAGDSCYLGRTADPMYTAKLIVPGTYQIVYGWNGQTTTPIDVPRNSSAVVRSSVMVQQTGALDVDIPGVTLSGKITVNGQVPTANTGSVTLRDTKSGDSFSLGRTADPMYTAKMVVPGTYDIYYSWNGQTTTPIDVPRNSNARLRTAVTFKDSGALDVDVPAVTISGKITVNAQLPMARSGQVLLGNPAIGDSFSLGRTGDATYTPKLVVPAPYNINYNWSGATDVANDVPRNSLALIGCKVLM